MVGFGGFQQRLAILLFMARVPDGSGRASWPMVRRDALHGLGLLGSCNEQVSSTLRASLEDPYFEARYRAAWAIRKLAGPHQEALAELVPALLQTHNHSFFEVRVEVLRALGEVAPAFGPIAEAFGAHRYDRNWKVRKALLTALGRLAERGIISNEEALAEGREVMLSGSGYLTQYPLKQAFNDLPDGP
jgi:HEAT repeat protein